MRLPKYKQRILDVYNATDFSGYNLTNAEKEMYEKIFFDSLKSSYCLVSLENPYYKTEEHQKVFKSLMKKGLVDYFATKGLGCSKLILKCLEEYRNSKKKKN